MRFLEFLRNELGAFGTGLRLGLGSKEDSTVTPGGTPEALTDGSISAAALEDGATSAAALEDRA